MRRPGHDGTLHRPPLPMAAPAAMRRARRLPRSLAFALVLVLSAALTVPAAAFDVDRDNRGQILRFAKRPVAVYLQATPLGGLTAKQVETAVKAAILTWNTVPGAHVQFVYGGLVVQPPLFDVYITFDGAFAIEADDPDLTGRTVRFSGEDGRLTRSEITLDAKNFLWIVGSAPQQPAKPPADLQGALTHHLGHALGLGHSRFHLASMYFFGTQSWMRTLESDDQRGAGFAYPLPAPAAATGGQCDACQADSDCVGGRCLAWPDGSRHCALGCGSHGDCPIGSSCGTFTGGTACLPNEAHCHVDAATVGLGQPCASDLACGKGRFCMTMNGAAFCTQACPCGSNAECFSVSTGGSICLAPGSGKLGDRCAGPAGCASLMCAPSIAGYGFCTQPCKLKAECGASGTCAANGLCEIKGSLPLGWPCETGFDCAGGQCSVHAGGKFARVCSKPCEIGADCPVGTGCTPASGGSLCLPFGPAVDGGPCLGDGACGTQLTCDVGLLPGVGACRTLCQPFGDDLDCPSGGRCVWLGATDGKATGACRPSGGGAVPGQECGTNLPCRVDLACAGAVAKSATCKPDCDVATGAGCAPGQACVSLSGMPGGPGGRGVCSDQAGVQVLVLPVSPAGDNFAARAVNLPKVIPAAEFKLPAPKVVEKDPEGCRAGRTARPLASLLLFLTALVACGLVRRWRLGA